MNKRVIYRRMITLCIGSLTLLYGCASGLIPRPASKDIHAEVLKHEPYCGGAKPSKSQEAGHNIVLGNMSFYIKEGAINHDTIPILRRVTTDSLGRFNVQLGTGIYALIFKDKHQPLEAFYQEKSIETKVLKAGTADCFQTWWQTPEALFHISDTTSMVQCTIRSTCNAGFNPCMNYIGPKRP